ncbi:MAG: tetratricopeptide repeat protein [Bacteroidales bacterium]|nr:tetratricopeptide repeat protein [Bacteroidales bacterium]
MQSRPFFASLQAKKKRFLTAFQEFIMEDKDDFLQQEEILDAVARFEAMMKSKTSSYFDIAELEGIIDYYLEFSDLNSALQASLLAERLHPANTSIQLKKAIILMDREKLAEAQQLLDSITRYDSIQDEVDIAYIKLNLYRENFQAASDLNRGICDRADESKTDLLIDLAQMFYQFFQFKEAEILLRLAYSFDNEDPEILLKLSEQIIRSNNIDGAILLYEEFLHRFPFSELVWFNLANCYAVLDQFEKAHDAYDYALAIDEEFAPAYNAKGSSYFEEEVFDKAIDCFQDFLKYNDEKAPAYFQLGLCYERMTEFEEAIRYFKLAADEQPGFAEPFFMLSTIEYQKEDQEKALELVNQALSMDEMNPEYLFLKGKIYLKTEEWEKSVEAFSKAVQEDATDTESWYNLAFALNRLGRTEKAIVELNKGLEISVDDADLMYHLSASWFQIGNDSNAMKHFMQAYFLNPDNLEDLYEYYPELESNQSIRDFIADEGI